MTIQNYSLYTKNAFEGQQAYGSEPHVVVSGNNESPLVSFGKALKFGVAEDGVLLGGAANVYGVALREVNHEATYRPSDGTTDYKEGETISVFRQGTINVLVTGLAAVRGAPANVNTTTGAFEGGAVAGGAVEALNVMFIQSGAVGDIVKARIDIIV